LKISIIIVSFRSAQLTIDCLRSVEQERSTPESHIRAVVVDNASGDFPAICESVAQNDWNSWVTPLLAPRNGGFAYGNNLGIHLALEEQAPDFILLLNPDTQVRPGAIGTLARFLATHPEIGIAGSSFENLDGSDWPIAFRFPSLVSELCGALDMGPVTRLFGRWAVARQMSRLPQPADWICGACMMIRPEVIRAIGGFDENYFLYFEETDFCLRAGRAGFPTWYVPESRVMHIGGQSTGVTERNTRPKRLPRYWFESRRRYLTVALGIRQAIAADLLVLAAYPLGWSKRFALGRSDTSIPYFWRDLARASVLRR
jgi:N-acetylglucosaminyl-diphospho-decaprenol L-rhamnosyltransferase